MVAGKKCPGHVHSPLNNMGMKGRCIVGYKQVGCMQVGLMLENKIQKLSHVSTLSGE